jgi:hypothetical protein
MDGATVAWYEVRDGRNLELFFAKGHNLSVDLFKQFVLQPLQEVLDSGREFTLFVDTTDMGTIPFSIGVDVVSFMRKNRPKFRDFCRASAIVVNTEFVSGLLQWVFALSPPVSPNLVVQKAKRTEAEEFIANATWS